MLYIISDIHGDLPGFQNLLRRISFSPSSDKMILAGDVIDRGRDSAKLLSFIRPYRKQGSMELLLGNHEMFARMYLEGKLSARIWHLFGGKSMLEAIQGMDAFERDALLAELQELPYYMEISSPHLGDVVVTHTGLHADYLVERGDGRIDVVKSIEQAFEAAQYDFMVGRDLHDLPYGVKKRLDRYLIVGHVPCFLLNEDGSNRAYRTPYYMGIDMGNGHKAQGGILGCYCVDTDEIVSVGI